jgi:hypothetical protein
MIKNHIYIYSVYALFMTDSKLIKYLEKINSKTDQAPIGPRIRKPFIISDSKGRYLREHIQSPVENQIIWRIQSLFDLCICYSRISSTQVFQEMLLYSVGNDSPFQ